MPGLRIAFVPGVTPGKWLDRWRDRYPDAPVEARLLESGDPLEVLEGGGAELVFLRFPDGQSPAGAALHVIPLYEELPVVCAPKEHDVELYDDEVPASELAGFTVLDLDDYPPEIGGVRMALEVVGSGAGVVVLPLSVARQYQRKDVVHRVLAGAPTTRIGLAWRRPQGDDPEDPLIEEFVGIVRGRGANSSRQPSVQERQQAEAAKAQKRRQSSAAPSTRGGQRAGGSKGAGPSKGSGKPKGSGKGGPRKPGGRGKR
ncbi:substrate-binding domain-containing protein [Zafaria sp. J156]|uniref:substrate-binding domain-containing protein n=1 Tax=Zafaria sp. J156 TaxID=3116490 RepID=UPI002E77B53C|nr:substrate-binding domain-containing protein [Zafaria sp. J156]MEE1621450.1 substrate-binding domain-containing protein [Zafaria sp. J156]